MKEEMMKMTNVKYYIASIIAGFVISVISTFLSIFFNLLRVPDMLNYLLYLLISTAIYIPIVLVFTAFILNDLKRITKLFME